MAPTRIAALAASTFVALIFGLGIACTPAIAGDRRAPWDDPWGAPPWMLGVAPPAAALSAGFHHPCAGMGVRWIDRATSYAAGFMDLKPAQEKALQAMQDHARTAGDHLRDTCRDAVDWKGTAPERLKSQEEILGAAREALRDVRPKFEAFYDTLAPRQKEVLDDVIAGRRPIPWGWWYEDY